MMPTPFKIVWEEAAVERLFEQIRGYTFPPAIADSSWRFGCDADYLRAFCTAWTDGYDWRAAVERLNGFPHFTTEVDGVRLHFVHIVGEAKGRRPLLLTHGWPSSVFEFWGVIDALAHPSRNGGRAEDAFDLVIPSLPGFAWSGRTPALVDQRETARLFDRLMTETLGYDRYLAQGGDWGALVTAMLGLHHARSARGIALTMAFPQPAATPTTKAELAWAADARAVEAELGAYAQLQGSRPQSLAWAMAGNPVGQAAWILERFHDWADLRDRPFEAVFDRDRLITNVMIYLMEDAFASSVRYYAAALAAGTRRLEPGVRIEVPTAFAFYPDPRHPMPPRSIVEQGYRVSRWSEMPRGGHFPAIEVPELWVGELRDWAREADRG